MGPREALFVKLLWPLVPYQTAWQYFDGNPPNVGVECRWGRQKSWFWANIWLHRMLWTLRPPSAVNTIVGRYLVVTSICARVQNRHRFRLSLRSSVRASHAGSNSKGMTIGLMALMLHSLWTERDSCVSDRLLQWRIQVFRKGERGGVDRGAVGAEEVVVWRGVPPHWGWGKPLPQKFYLFFVSRNSIIGAFWSVFKVCIPIFACHFCARQGNSYGLRMTWEVENANEVHVGPRFGQDGQKQIQPTSY